MNFLKCYSICYTPKNAITLKISSSKNLTITQNSGWPNMGIQ